MKSPTSATSMLHNSALLAKELLLIAMAEGLATASEFCSMGLQNRDQ